jgi:hypothetical protein
MPSLHVPTCKSILQVPASCCTVHCQATAAAELGTARTPSNGDGLTATRTSTRGMRTRLVYWFDGEAAVTRIPRLSGLVMTPSTPAVVNSLLHTSPSLLANKQRMLNCSQRF